MPVMESMWINVDRLQSNFIVVRAVIDTTGVPDELKP